MTAIREILKSPLALAMAGGGGMILLLQLMVFGAMLDLMSDFFVIGIAFVLGRMSK
ncbi:hypothetical protein EVB27_051 [Rhizobium phage RHph_TM16]|nr:hypothetical protein EVB27_051 [Rhizobium phage RHph_TM16]